MTGRLSLVFFVLAVSTVLVFAVLTVVHPAPGIAQEGEGTPGFDGPKLSKQIKEHLEALAKGAVAETTQGALGLQLHLFPDARRYDLLARLGDELRRGQDPLKLVEELAQDKKFAKRLKRLDGRAGFRLDLIHPEKKDEIIRTRQVVHMFDGQLTKSFSLRFGSKGVQWSGWRDPRGLESKTVRIARHWTIENHRRVAKTSAMKPKRLRAVMRTREASLWGFFPGSLLKKKKGAVRIVIPSYIQFTGHYTDEHIVDLNEAAHILEKDLSIEATRPLPLFFPDPPDALEEYLEWVEARLKSRK